MAIKIIANFEINEDQKKAYIKAIQDIMKEKGENPEKLSKMKLRVNPMDKNMVEVDYWMKDEEHPIKFERIRRITGC